MSKALEPMTWSRRERGDAGDASAPSKRVAWPSLDIAASPERRDAARESTTKPVAAADGGLTFTEDEVARMLAACRIQEARQAALDAQNRQAANGDADDPALQTDAQEVGQGVIEAIKAQKLLALGILEALLGTFAEVEGEVPELWRRRLEAKIRRAVTKIPQQGAVLMLPQGVDAERFKRHHRLPPWLPIQTGDTLREAEVALVWPGGSSVFARSPIAEDLKRLVRERFDADEACAPSSGGDKAVAALG